MRNNAHLDLITLSEDFSNFLRASWNQDSVTSDSLPAFTSRTDFFLNKHRPQVELEVRNGARKLQEYVGPFGFINFEGEWCIAEQGSKAVVLNEVHKPW